MKAKFILYIQAWVRHGLGLGLGLLVLAQCQLSGSLFSVKNVCSDRASHDMFACGEGTSTSPFVIASDEQLNNTPDFLDSHFEVARDLDMDGILRQPIGTDTTPFTGSFKGLRPNGQPAVISNVMINMPGSDNIGFFGAATNSATIENVGLENVMIVGRTNVGGLVGRNDGAGRISNSYATGTVEGDSEVGGLVGRNSATIFNSYATGRVTGTNQVGGLVGESNADTISNSYAAGAVTGMGNSVGGLVGNNDDSTIFNSYATGRVTGTNQVGGLVGESNADTISNSYAAGAVTGMGNSVGGLVGNNDDSTIFNSYATGTVTGTNQVGGLVGESNADTISNSYATGAVTGMGNSVGGLVGDNESTISNSYATGNVTGTGSAIGGFVGLNNSTIDEINYFVDSDGVNGVGSGSCNGTCERRNESAILGYTNSVMNVDTINVSGLDSWDPDNWDFRSSISPQQHPAVKYAPFDADDDSIIDTAEGCGSLCGQLLPKQGEDDDSDTVIMAPPDADSDGTPDNTDVDDDGDGLIEIHDLDMLDNVRNTLDGTAYNDGGGDNTTGCGGQTGITSCSGYELSRDLDFSSGSSYALGSINSAWRPTGGNPGTATNPGWTPIGSSFSNSFTGTFDGNGHSISNLYVRVSSSGTARAGLFGHSGSSAAIRNTGVVAAAVFASNSNFFVYAGGLVGLNNGGSISNSYATGSVSASSSSDAFAGGLVGVNFGGSISNSYATGSVSASASSDAAAGGLMGLNNGGSISNSYATGSASASGSTFAYAGGLVGENSGSISNSYATGSVSASGSSAFAGGLVGENRGSISNSYATGSVSASSSSSDAYAGGLVGVNRSFVGSIRNSYATGSVSASSVFARTYAGGLVGWNDGDIISNSYWDRGTVVLIEDGAIVSAEDQDIGNTGDHAGVTALSSSQMQATSGTYPDMLGADFNLGTSSEYPLLEYGGTVGTDCKNSGDADLPVCGTLLPAQEVRMASGFLRFSNTAIGEPSSTDFVFFYDIGSGNTIDISGTGVNGTTAGSYAIEDASGTALTGYSFSATSGSSTITLPTLSAGDEFYLKVTFTKGSDSFTQRYRFRLSDMDSDGIDDFRDVDDDGDGLIEISTLTHLNAIRNDLDGDGLGANSPFDSNTGCPVAGCNGYELTANLDFDTDGDGATHTSGVGDPDDTYYNGGMGWDPIGDCGTDNSCGNADDNLFAAVFEGNGNTISNLFIDRSNNGIGLFGRTASGSEIRNLGLVDLEVTGNWYVGGLVGRNSGTITASYATGTLTGNRFVGGLAGSSGGMITASYATSTVMGTDRVGGLVGTGSGMITASYATGRVTGAQYVGGLVGWNSGPITASYATGTVTLMGTGSEVGGLVGFNESRITASYATGMVDGGTGSSVGGLVGQNRSIIGTITASYATGTVMGTGSNVGGLVGQNFGTITASYATGAVTGTGATNVGGLVGSNPGTITASYFDRSTTGQSGGQTTAQLQMPTMYGSGIYSGWDVDVDNDDGDDNLMTGMDDPWDFGAMNQYPALRVDFDGDGTASVGEFGMQR